jgi:hypothetical protein
MKGRSEQPAARRSAVFGKRTGFAAVFGKGDSNILAVIFGFDKPNTDIGAGGAAYKAPLAALAGLVGTAKNLFSGAERGLKNTHVHVNGFLRTVGNDIDVAVAVKITRYALANPVVRYGYVAAIKFKDAIAISKPYCRG